VRKVELMELEVFKIDGSKTGDIIKLLPEVFEIDPNDHAIYLAVNAFLENRRQGTHKTKTRAEVSGGGKKPWKQKHTGRARSGSIRNPLWVGGGTIFGPQPHKYEKKVNEKVKRLARKSALSYKAKENALVVVEDFEVPEVKTKQVQGILKSLGLNEKKVLMLLPKFDSKTYLASRNLKRVNVMSADVASTYDLLNNDVILFQRSALENLQSKLAGVA